MYIHSSNGVLVVMNGETWAGGVSDRWLGGVGEAGALGSRGELGESMVFLERETMILRAF